MIKLEINVNSEGRRDLANTRRNTMTHDPDLTASKFSTTNLDTIMKAAKKLECSNKFFRKSPLPQSPIFLPFLYQTRTIRSGRWQLSPDHPHDKSPWIPRPDHIPFEIDGQSTLGPQRTYGRQWQSTITNREREAFRKLFDMVVKNPPNKSKAQSVQSEEELRARCQQPEATEILENAARAVRQTPSEADNLERFPEPLRYMAAVANQKIQEQQHRRRIEEELLAPETEPVSLDDPVMKLQEVQHARIEQLLQAAPTDHDLWMILEDHVFSVIRKLDLDGKEVSTSPQPPNPHSNEQNKTAQVAPAARPSSNEQKEKTEAPETAAITGSNQPSSEAEKPEQLAIIGPNYPSFLLIAIRQLRTHFPASNLPFQIIPTIKQLGRSSYVLGASTPLYNELIAATWHISSDFRKIDDLLKEMDNSGLEFDENTLDLLDKIKREGEKALEGKQGEVKRLWWNTEMIRSGWNGVVDWIPLIQERLRATAVRLANERDSQREELEYEAASETWTK